MKHKPAIRPDYFGNFRDVLAKQQEANVKGVDEEQNHLYALSQHEGWRILKEYIDQLVTNLEDIIKNGMALGATFEELGINAVTIQLVKNIIKQVKDKVEDAKEAVENQTGGK